MRFFYLILISFFLQSCSSSDFRYTVNCVNMTGQYPMVFEVNDSLKASYYQPKVPIASIFLKEGIHHIKAIHKGELIDSASVEINKDKNGHSYFFNPHSKGSYAIVNINSLYEGGGVFDLANSEKFEVLLKSKNEKIFSLKDPSRVLIAGSTLPKTLEYTYNGVSYFFPIPDEVESDEDILKVAVKNLQRDMK